MPRKTVKKATKPRVSKTAAKRTSPVKIQRRPATKAVKKEFALSAPEAKRVTVCGEFNGWKAEATPMKRRGDGTWKATLTLRPGRYQYKFVVDGNWIHDPNAQINVPNEHGSLNSVIEFPG